MSVLKFTYEVECQKKMSFLDTLITRSQQGLTATVFTKSTSSGDCLNYESICPECYKISVIKGFLHRAYSICSTWELFNIEKDCIKQMLVDNNFPNELIDKIVSEFLQKKFPSNNTETSSRPSQPSSIPESNSDQDQIRDSEAHTDSQ